MKIKWRGALVVAAVGAAAFYAGGAFATPGTGITTTIVAQAPFDPLNLTARAQLPFAWHAKVKTHGPSDLYVVDNVIDPGGTTGWHSHLGPSLIIVKRGTITNYLGNDPTCTPHTYTVGQGFVDPGGKSVHILRNEGTEQAETIAVQFVPQGGTRRIEESAPGNCPF
jgi:quercetin dioxygenase-like cupin family protein